MKKQEIAYAGVKMPVQMLDKVKQIAESDDRSMASVIRTAIKEYISSRAAVDGSRVA